ncbi:hypothetical protein M0813_20093 [Anaeramoeba flamelloides]|uniref:Stealth protein CR2 conserved region 2 domain-containing protein n=1 Tax=Anaeramoeba flamelloides TaxID=1746091 RepID=A0ABQ8YM62_9EUKA|nr:hypothetical protein M0813_20093 [Anaeramoeba flamelloides]
MRNDKKLLFITIVALLFLLALIPSVKIIDWKKKGNENKNNELEMLKKEIEKHKEELSIEKKELEILKNEIENTLKDFENKQTNCQTDTQKEKESEEKKKKIELEKEFLEIRKEILNDEGKIDLVYTWGGVTKSMSIRNRYNYELQYSLRSVDKYLPWVNKIYILINSDTDYPYWLKKQEKLEKIVIVDRCTLIKNPDHCPTRNTFAVFSAVHKVKGLSKKFVLIDDDVFINQPLTPDYFFSEDGLPKILQARHRRTIYKEDDFSDRNYPVYKWEDSSHLPKPMRRDFILKFHEKYPTYAEFVQSHKTRYKALSEEFSMILHEFFHEEGLMIEESPSKAKKYQIPFSHPEEITQEFDNIYKDLTTQDWKVFNCNDDFSTKPEVYKEQRKVLFRFYNRLFPEVPDFEIPNPDHEKYS